MSSRRFQALGLVATPSPQAPQTPPRAEAPPPAVVPDGAINALVTLVRHYQHGAEATLRVRLCSQASFDAAGPYVPNDCVVTVRQLLQADEGVAEQLTRGGLDVRCLAANLGLTTELITVVPEAMKNAVRNADMSAAKLTLHLYQRSTKVAPVAPSSLGAVTAPPASPIRALLESLQPPESAADPGAVLAKANASPRKAVGYRTVGPFSSPRATPDYEHVAKLHPPSAPPSLDATAPDETLGSVRRVALFSPQSPARRHAAQALPVEALAFPAKSPPRAPRPIVSIQSIAVQSVLDAHSAALRRDTVPLQSSTDVAAVRGPDTKADVVRRWIDAAKSDAESRRAASVAAESASAKSAGRSRRLTTVTA